jgi:hypothetical protein
MDHARRSVAASRRCNTADVSPRANACAASPPTIGQPADDRPVLVAIGLLHPGDRVAIGKVGFLRIMPPRGGSRGMAKKVEVMVRAAPRGADENVGRPSAVQPGSLEGSPENQTVLHGPRRQAALAPLEQPAKLRQLRRRDDPVGILRRLLQAVANACHAAGDRKRNAGRPQFVTENIREFQRGLHGMIRIACPSE